ncbi:hypothetical protein BDZ89DRAFT_1067654, partial [Hymenopellis radicata]
MESFPDLPVHVARLLIEVAAWSNRPTTARNLVLVSKTVRQWIDPILHHTIVLDTEPKFYAFVAAVASRKDPDFFRRNVRVLAIGNFELGGFPNATDDVPPDNLHDGFAVIFGACTESPRLRDSLKSLVMFPGLTHLHLSGNAFQGLFIYASQTTFHPVLSALPDTVSHLIISLCPCGDISHAAAHLRAFEADRRIVFICPKSYLHKAVQGLH